MGMENKLDQAIRQLVNLAKHDGPPLLKAHCIVNVLIPRLIAAAGCVEQVGYSIGVMMTARLCDYMGLCAQCHKEPISGPNEMFCVKCGAEADQFIAEVMKE